SQQNSAVRTPPMCRSPVGLGAKRVRTVMGRRFYRVDPLGRPPVESPPRRAVSSAVEHCFHTAGVTGSNPVPPTRPSATLWLSKPYSYNLLHAWAAGVACIGCDPFPAQVATSVLAFRFEARGRGLRP